MLHLLPDDHKQKVVLEYRQRVVVVLCLGIIVLVLLSMFFLMPAYFSSFSKYAVVEKAQVDLEAHIRISENRDDADKVKEIVSSVDTLKQFIVKEFPTEIFARIILSKPRGVVINHFVYTPNVSSGVSTEPATVDLSGIADTRAKLLAFNDSLKRDKAFKSVYIPLSSFAKERTISFSIKLVVSNDPTDWGYVPRDTVTSALATTSTPVSSSKAVSNSEPKTP